PTRGASHRIKNVNTNVTLAATAPTVRYPPIYVTQTRTAGGDARELRTVALGAMGDPARRARFRRRRNLQGLGRGRALFATRQESPDATGPQLSWLASARSRGARSLPRAHWPRGGYGGNWAQRAWASALTSAATSRSSGLRRTCAMRPAIVRISSSPI